MDDRYSSCCGALVGLAVGDAMGFPAENLTLTQIYESYGPMGLQGFDLLNGGVSITSYTQLAAYVANGLILGLTRGQLKGSMAPFIRYVEMAEREWASTRLYPESGEKKKCWVSSAPTLKTAQCMDNFMLDSLYRGLVATMDEPRNHLKNPGAITAAVPIGLFINPASVPQDQIDLLGAQTVALTHGDPTAFLSGAVLTHVLSRAAWGGVTDMWDLIRETSTMLQRRYAAKFPQANAMADKMRQILEFSIVRKDHTDVMQWLHCSNCCDVLMGALYANLANPGDFDGTLITAVNHSGKSGATGAVAGAIAGTLLGHRAISRFYLESLPPAKTLRELGADLHLGCPNLHNGMFVDAAWDERYVKKLG